MDDKDIALSFDTAEYYNLQEASDYLNRKYKTENITPKKLLKQISSRNINSFVHFRMNNLSSKSLRLQIDSYDSNVFPGNKDIHDLDKSEVKPLVKILNRLEDIMSLSLIDELYMGSILFRVNEACLFNMSLNNNSANETYVFSFDGFISKYSRDDDPAKPSQLEEWQVDSVGKNYYLTQIGCMNFIIDSIDDNDLREFEESIPFSCSFEKRDSFSIPHLKIDLKDIIILHKDLLNLEDAIIRNKPITEQTQLKPRQGISHKKMLAKEVAKNIAIETWTKDIDKKIKISAMCEIIWFKLIDVGFSKELPANKTSLKQWIKEVTPKYASEAGRPAS